MFNIFKSRAQREQEQLAQEAKKERAYDLGRKTSQEVCAIIDRYFEARGLPAAQRINEKLKETIEKTHKTSEAQVHAEWRFCLDLIDAFKERAIEEANDALGDWKYTLIEVGMRDITDQYIQHKLKPILEVLTENGKGEAAYALARIRGIITDEQHSMPLEELRRSLGNNG